MQSSGAFISSLTGTQPANNTGRAARGSNVQFFVNRALSHFLLEGSVYRRGRERGEGRESRYQLIPDDLPLTELLLTGG